MSFQIWIWNSWICLRPFSAALNLKYYGLYLKYLETEANTKIKSNAEDEVENFDSTSLLEYIKEVFGDEMVTESSNFFEHSAFYNASYKSESEYGENRELVKQKFIW